MVLRGFPPPIFPASSGNMIFGKEFPLASRAAGAPHAPGQDTLGGPPAAARELEAVKSISLGWPSTDLSIADCRRPMTSSSCASVMISGGQMRMKFLTQMKAAPT